MGHVAQESQKEFQMEAHRWPRSKVGTPVATSLLGLLVGVLVWTFFLGNSEQHWQAQLEQASAIGVVPANITRAPAAATCGAWQKPYSTFHAKARAKLERTKVLVFSCRSGVGGGDNTCRGLGAPLVGISTAFLLARLTGRAFFVDWAALEGAFEPQHGGIEWRASQAPGVPQLVAEAPGGAAPPPPECNFGEPGGAGSATTIAGGISLNLVGRKVSGSELAACLGQLKDTHVVQVQMDASFDTWAAVVPEDVTGGTPGGIVAVHPFSSGCLLHYLLSTPLLTFLVLMQNPCRLQHDLKAQLEQASAIGVVPANITRAPAAATCGAWQKPYSTFHAKARAKLERTKVLVFSCRSGVGGGDNTCRGLGAPLVGISTAFLLARLTGRAFFVDWAALEGAFEPQHGGIEWRASQAPGVPQLVAEAPGGAAPPPPECNFGEPGGAGSATTIAGGISLNLVGRKVSGSELAACLGQLKDTHVVQVQMDASFDTWAAVVPEDVTGGTPGGIVAVHPFSSGCLLHYLLR
eukprot:jgi/Mesen1/5189/ME000258S04285